MYMFVHNMSVSAIIKIQYNQTNLFLSLWFQNPFNSEIFVTKIACTNSTTNRKISDFSHVWRLKIIFTKTVLRKTEVTVSYQIQLFIINNFQEIVYQWKKPYIHRVRFNIMWNITFLTLPLELILSSIY